MSGSTRTQSKVVTSQTVALEHLRRAIATREMRPGDQIRQDSVARDLGLSIVPVREALKVLQTEGQIRYETNRGYFVSKLSSLELQEAYHIRNLLEDEALRIGVPLLTDEDLDQLDKAIMEMDEANRQHDVARLSEANRRFHFIFFAAAAMPRMTNFIRILWDTTEPYRAMFFNEAKHRHKVNEEHRLIVAATRDGNVSETVKLMRAHRMDTVTELTGLLVPDENPAPTSSVRVGVR